MSDPTGFVAFAIEGQTVASSSPESVSIVREEGRSVRRTAAGTYKQTLAWWGEAALNNATKLVPETRFGWRITVNYANIRGDAEALDRVLATPGPWRVAKWKPAVLSYLGDGSKTEFYVPWKSAADDSDFLVPGRVNSSAHSGPDPRVRVDDTDFTVVKKDTAAYDAGSPAASEAWWETGGQRFKVLTAPGSATRVYLTLYPLLQMIKGEDQPREYNQFSREPRSLILVEVAS